MFFDLTPSIKPANPRAYLWLRLLILLAAIFLLIHLVLWVLLPTLRFSHNVPNTDPAFDLSKVVDSAYPGSLSMFYASLSESVDRADITIELDESWEVGDVREFIAHARKTYSATLAPKTEQEFYADSEEAPFPVGSLIRSTAEYFVVSDRQIFTLNDPNIIKAFGYNFEDGKDSTSSQRSYYESAGTLRMRDLHPEGVQFRDLRSDTYLLNQPPGLLETPVALPEVPIIDFDSRSHEVTTDCELRTQLFHPRSLTCQISLEDIAAFPGKDYVFDTNIPPSAIKSIKVELSVSPTPDNIQSRLVRIKGALFP